MTVRFFTVNPFQENTYVCHDDGEAVLIDPGTSTAGERRQVLDYLDAHGLIVRHLLLTHAHLDHILDCAYFAERFGQAFQVHPEEVELLEHAQEQAALFGVPLVQPPPPGRLLRHGDTIAFGGTTWSVLHCPGHSSGSICFHDAANGFVIAGDVLFRGSVGRTDLWKGSMEQLVDSIRTHLFALDDETVVYTGHGPATTIGAERRTNPFLNAAS